MKTTKQQTTTSLIAFAFVLFFSQNALAQNSTLSEDDSIIHNLTFMVSVFLFIVGFTALIVLKMRDDSKKQQQNNQSQQIHTRHRNHYGHKHQYNH